MISWLIIGYPVLLPVLAAIGIEILFLHALRKRAGRLQIFETGVFFSLIVLLYAVFPALTLFANGFEYPAFGDGRLFTAQPSSRDVEPIYWLYVLFLAAFNVTYYRLRKPDRLPEHLAAEPDKGTFWVLAGLYAVIRGFFIFVTFHYKIAEPESYGDRYLALKGLPLIIQQLANHLGGIALTLQILMMANMVFNYRKYRVVIFVWLTLEFAGLALFGVGARFALFALILAFMITFHLAVKRLSKRMVAVAGLALLILFVGLGIIRALSDSPTDEAMNFLNASNEFDGVFANAFDLRDLKAAGETQDISPRFYFVDFLNLIPQQLSPFRKLDLGDWYVGTFYPELAERGGGLAFGVISESIIGQGWIEVLARGAVLGWMFAFVYGWMLRNPESFWRYGLYLWTTVLSYNCFRSGTFALVPRFVFQFLLVVVFVKVAIAVFGRETRLRRDSGSSALLSDAPAG
jgi:hypothetical protein